MSGNFTQQSKRQNILGGLCLLWGAGGFVWMLVDAIFRLGSLVLHGIGSGETVAHWIEYAAFAAVMGYLEGYRGFQRSFSPRTASRAYYLYSHPTLLTGLLAPFFCMGFFRANRRPLLVAWVGTGLIVALVVALRVMPQPWRGVVDAGVVVGLSWGLVSFLIFLWRALNEHRYIVSPEVPGYAQS